MQAKLPDINASITTHRGVMLSSYAHGLFARVISSFRAIIALMPEDYRLQISTKEYTDEIRSKTFFTCLFCDKPEISFNDIELYEKLNNEQELLQYGKKYSKHWLCPHCNVSNNFEASNKLLDLPGDPYYIRMIPSPPRIYDTFSRLGYKERFAAWFEIALPELEHQIGLFRTNYIQDIVDEDEIDETVGDFEDE